MTSAKRSVTKQQIAKASTFSLQVAKTIPILITKKEIAQSNLMIQLKTVIINLSSLISGRKMALFAKRQSVQLSQLTSKSMVVLIAPSSESMLINLSKIARRSVTIQKDAKVSISLPQVTQKKQILKSLRDTAHHNQALILLVATTSSNNSISGRKMSVLIRKKNQRLKKSSL